MQSLEIAEDYLEDRKYFEVRQLELLGSKDTIAGKVYMVRKKEK